MSKSKKVLVVLTNDLLEKSKLLSKCGENNYSLFVRNAIKLQIKLIQEKHKNSLIFIQKDDGSVEEINIEN